MSEQRQTILDSANDRSRSGFCFAAVFFLAGTVAVALLWSHVKLLWFDELIELYTDGVGSAREVLRIQRHYPISLDPALFHVIAHASTRLFGVTAFGMRLPALLGFLLAQICCYLFARRIAGTTAALLALGLPALSGMLLYAVEGRPYGLLYGLYGVSLVAYQAATREDPGASVRNRWLIVLAIAIAAAINTHWFGILILVPLCTAELVRTVQCRRLDWPLLLAGALGAAGFLLVLPFHAGVARYGVHYYADNTVNLHTLTLCYRVLFFSDLQVGNLPQKLMMAAAIAVVLATIVLVGWQRRRGRINLPAPELAMLCTLLVLPCFGYVVALVVTHTMSIRYVFAAGLAMAILIGCAFAPLLRTVASRRLVTIGLFAALAGMGWFHISRERAKTAAIAKETRFDPAVAAVLNAPPGGAIYMVNLFPGTLYERYTPDPAMRRRVTLLYSFDQELALRHRDTQALTVFNMTHFTGFPLESYEALRQRGGTSVFAISPDTWWDWSRDALQKDGATLRDIGPGFGGEVVEVTFPRTSSRMQ